VYKVVDTSLYSVSSTGVETLIGTISGTEQVIFADDGVNMLIATSAYAYQYNGSTLSALQWLILVILIQYKALITLRLNHQVTL
jgi:hypothetical protein